MPLWQTKLLSSSKKRAYQIVEAAKKAIADWTEIVVEVKLALALELVEYVKKTKTQALSAELH